MTRIPENTPRMTRRDMLHMLALSAPVAGVTGLLLTQTACGTSLTTDLTLIVDATSAAVDIAFPQYAALLNPYFTAVSTFIGQVTTELATTDTPAQKIAVITQDAAAIVTPDVSGLPLEIIARVAAIAPLIAKLVDEIKGLTAAIDRMPGGANAFFAAHRKLKAPSAQELDKVRAKNAALKARLLKTHARDLLRPYNSFEAWDDIRWPKPHLNVR